MKAKVKIFIETESRHPEDGEIPFIRMSYKPYGESSEYTRKIDLWKGVPFHNEDSAQAAAEEKLIEVFQKLFSEAK